MNTVLNLGSLNVDFTYRVSRIVQPGETRASSSLTRGAGGKGLNQSLALARAGAHVVHIGAVGPDGGWLRELLAGTGVDVDAVAMIDAPTGHALIQVSTTGENAIVLFPGANHGVSAVQAAAVVAAAPAGALFLTQNETNAVVETMAAARRRGLEVIFNPAPMSPEVRTYPLSEVDYLVVNESEAAELTGVDDWRRAGQDLAARCPETTVIVTAGAQGAGAFADGASIAVPAFRVQAVDTTGAGDVFVGYLAAAVAGGVALDPALRHAAAAAALSVTRRGAAGSVPRAEEVERFLAEQGR